MIHQSKEWFDLTDRMDSVYEDRDSALKNISATHACLVVCQQLQEAGYKAITDDCIDAFREIQDKEIDRLVAARCEELRIDRLFEELHASGRDIVDDGKDGE